MYISTGGGSPGSSVRGQHGIKDALINKTNKTDKSNNKINRDLGTTGGSSTPSKAVIKKVEKWKSLRVKPGIGTTVRLSPRKCPPIDSQGGKDGMRSMTGARKSRLASSNKNMKARERENPPRGRYRIKLPGKRNYIRHSSSLRKRTLKSGSHQIFIMFPVTLFPHDLESKTERWLRDIEAGRWPPKPKETVNNEEANQAAENDSETSSSIACEDTGEGRPTTNRHPPSNHSIRTMAPKKKMTPAEASAKREEGFRELCRTKGVNPDTEEDEDEDSSGGDTEQSDDPRPADCQMRKRTTNSTTRGESGMTTVKDVLDRTSDEEDELDRHAREPVLKSTTDNNASEEEEIGEEEDEADSTSVLSSVEFESPVRSRRKTVIESPILKVGGQPRKRSQVNEPPCATPSKNLKERPKEWHTPPSRLVASRSNRLLPPNPSVEEFSGSIKSMGASAVEEHISRDTPNYEEDPSENSGGIESIEKSSTAKTLSFAQIISEKRTYNVQPNKPAYDSDLDGSESSSQSGTAGSVGSLSSKEDSVPMEEEVEEVVLAAEISAPNPTITLEWSSILPDAGKAPLADLGGSGSCMLLCVCHQMWGDGGRSDNLRLAIMDKLRSNKEHYKSFCLVNDKDRDILTVEQYIEVHSKKNAYCGELELALICEVLEADVRVYSRHYPQGFRDHSYQGYRDSQFTRVLLEIAHIPNTNSLLDHYKSVRSSMWAERMKTRPTPPKALTQWNRGLEKLHVSSSGTLYDKNGVKVDNETMSQILRQGSGTFFNGLTKSKDHILIVGARPSRKIVNDARMRNLTLTTLEDFNKMASNLTSEAELKVMSKSFQVQVYSDNRGEDMPGMDGDKMTDSFARTRIDNDKMDDSTDTELVDLSATPPPTSSAKQKPSVLKQTNTAIPIDHELLDRINTSETHVWTALPSANRLPTDLTHKLVYVLVQAFHTEDDEDVEPDDLRKSVFQAYCMLHDHLTKTRQMRLR